jgi:unsaturated rhamnogalacturonyl hydrolase
LGWVQRVGAGPGQVDKDDTQLYGVGAFLLAASEVSKLPTAGGHYAQRAPTHLNP